MIRALIKRLSEQLPVVYDNSNCFYYLAEAQLLDFELSLNSLDSDTLTEFLIQVGEMRGIPTSKRFVSLINKINAYCLEILQYAYKGQFLESAKLLDSLMSVPKYTDYKLRDWYFNYMVSNFEAPMNLYRCVDFSDKENPEDCNHVPYQLRRFASIGRYNLLGYPCLYLCSSLECSQKELGKVADGKSRWYGEFNPKQRLSFLDFCLPSNEAIDHMDAYDMFCFLITYPLRLLCNYKMKNNTGSYSEEYMFSQLFLHIMFLNKKDIYPNFTGISYSSMHDRQCVNYVIPALYSGNRPPTEGHSQYILDLFEQITHQKL